MRYLLASALIIFGINSLHAQEQKTASSPTPLTLEESVLGQFRAFYPEHLQQLQWIKNSEVYTLLKGDSLFAHTTKGKSKVLFTLSNLKEWVKSEAELTSFPALQWMDSDHFFFEQKGKYVHVELSTKKANSTAQLPAEGENADYHASSKNLAFTKGNNLAILTNGSEKIVTNNSEDVVSGQSISRNEYGISKGTFWNNSGNALAFYEKNESQVTNYPLTDYKSTPARTNNIKYPMSGAKSEIVSVGVYHLSTDQLIYLDAAGGDRKSDQYYLTNLSWSPDDQSVFVVWINRSTDHLKLIQYDAFTGKQINVILEERDDKWVEPDQAITFLPDSKNQFLWYSWRDGFHTYYLYQVDGKEIGHFKTTFELTSILGFQKEKNKVYFSGTGEKAHEMHAFEGDLSTFTLTRITPVAGTHEVQLSSNGKWMLDTYSSLTIPNRTDFSSSSGRMIKNLVTAKNPLSDKLYGSTELFTIPANASANQPELYARLIKPSNFDASKKYPVVVYVYNGPHVQLVTNSWLGGSSLWMNYLAELGYLVFTVDGRGSAHRGKQFEQSIHRQLGDVELEDQLRGVEWLKKQSYVDANRMAVHGWSYGGFMTTSLMLRHPGTFQVGVAGGPVIDWELYEVMYTERYMDRPEENKEGYAKNRLTEYVKNLDGDLLMIHGTDDDVVVMQHNMRFLKACIDQKKEVDFFAYPGHAHNVRGKDRVHLINKVILYIQDHL